MKQHWWECGFPRVSAMPHFLETQQAAQFKESLETAVRPQSMHQTEALQVCDRQV